MLGGEKVAYQELEADGNRLAALLRAVGVTPGDRVVSLVPKSPHAIVGMQATLKAGAAYVP